MKGLLLKDYYLIKSALYIVLVIFAVVGIATSFLTSTWVLTIIATVMLGMISVTSINMDRASGWRKVSGVLPVSKETVMDSKYILYLLASSAGFFLGIVISIAVSCFKNQFDYDVMFSFTSISPAMALISGSITIPCGFLFSEEKNMISLIIPYPIAGAFFAGATLIFDNKVIACVVITAFSIILFAISWIISRRFIAKRDID